MAVGRTPRKSVRRGLGQLDVTVSIGNVECRPGDLVYADDDGIIILSPDLLPILVQPTE
jgi:regulator of ribonuclease activity A